MGHDNISDCPDRDRRSLSGKASSSIFHPSSHSMTRGGEFDGSDDGDGNDSDGNGSVDVNSLFIMIRVGEF